MAEKDWKNEYEKLKVQVADLRAQLAYERRNREMRENKADELRDKFKELIIEVLGR